MKTRVQESGFHCLIPKLLAAFCVFFSFGFAQADCIGGVGTDDIVISNKAPDFYNFDDVVDCIATGSITLGPDVTIPDGAVFNLIAPKVSIKTDVEAILGSQLHIFTQIRPLNDTGITSCSNEDTNGLNCPVANYPGQDAEYGRDVTHNDDSDGRAGFSFTRLGADGNLLPSDATSWPCVKDNVTGLIWEVKTNHHLHRPDRYSWYNTDSATNGGYPGYADDDLIGNTCYGYNSADSASYCNSQAYVARVNQAGWCGYNDWRMPTIEELRSLMDYYVPTPGPTIDTLYFPNARAWIFWSSSPKASSRGSAGSAWYLNFDGGGDDMDVKYYKYHVRLVRGGQ